MIFSKCVKFFWFLTTVCSMSSILVCSCLFGRIMLDTYENNNEINELLIFYHSLLWGTMVEIIASLLSIGSTTFFHCYTSRYTLQRRLPFWIFINVLFLYASIGSVLFPALKQINYLKKVDLLDHQKNASIPSIAPTNTTTTSIFNFDHNNRNNLQYQPQLQFQEEIQGHTSVSASLDHYLWNNDHHFHQGLINFYYGLLCGKSMVLIGFITTLYSYLTDLKRMNGLLNNLQFQFQHEHDNEFRRKSQIL